ncbi:MAG: SprT family zinc-dependent metalloprotease [bacterium]|nr:SprT family zinc-dependent metalloprotease [bacterium]
MEKEITLKDSTITYTLKKSTRARRVRLVVHCDGSVVVTLPRHFKESVAERFLKEKMNWVVSKLAFFEKFEGKSFGGYSYNDYVKHKENATFVVQKKVEYFARSYGYFYNRISIKNQRTCWGSCSKKGNLNFNYKILFLPENIQDYIVAHELCHLQELNHSKRFWKLLLGILPEYKEDRKQLKMYSLA